MGWLPSWLSRSTPEPDSYVLPDGRGVYVDPQHGPIVGEVVTDHNGHTFVAPTGTHGHDGQYDTWAGTPPPRNWRAEAEPLEDTWT